MGTDFTSESVGRPKLNIIEYHTDRHCRRPRDREEKESREEDGYDVGDEKRDDDAEERGGTATAATTPAAGIAEDDRRLQFFWDDCIKREEEEEEEVSSSSIRGRWKTLGDA